MRIGILTLPFNNNYGGYLQAYALMRTLKRMGHQPTLIMRRHSKPKVSVNTKVKLAIKGVLKTMLTFKRHQIIYDVEYSFKKRGRRMLCFVNKHMQPQTPYLYDSVTLRKYCEGQFDAYIVGSDQVWRAIYVPNIKNFFLDFTDGWTVRRIAYAASFGTGKPEYTEEQVKQCGTLINKFNSVSLREMSGADVIRKFGWHIDSVQTVLDPTLLLSSNDYSELLPQEESKSTGKIFFYVLDETSDIKNVLLQAKTLLSIELLGISSIQKKGDALDSIEEWLSFIRDAKFVITDSFHGTVFSIIFHKPFAVCANMDRGADRFANLLNMLGLSDRILTNEQTIDIVMNSKIDWSIVDSRTGKMKNDSLSFLNNALKSN